MTSNDYLRSVPPFTITITDGRDAHFLLFSILLIVNGGDKDKTESCLRLMLISLGRITPEDITSAFIETVPSNKKLPSFVGPFIIHILTHWSAVMKQEVDEIKKREEKPNHGTV